MQVPNFCFINAANTTKYLFEKWKKWFFSNPKYKKTRSTKNEKILVKFIKYNICNYAIVYFPDCQIPPGRIFKKDNSISIFTFLKFFLHFVFNFFLHWTIIVFVRIICKELDGIINRTSTKFDENIHKTQGALMLLVSACIGNLDLIPPASFEPDPIPLLYIPDIPIPS